MKPKEHSDSRVACGFGAFRGFSRDEETGWVLGGGYQVLRG